MVMRQCARFISAKTQTGDDQSAYRVTGTTAVAVQAPQQTPVKGRCQLSVVLSKNCVQRTYSMDQPHALSLNTDWAVKASIHICQQWHLTWSLSLHLRQTLKEISVYVEIWLREKGIEHRHHWSVECSWREITNICSYLWTVTWQWRAFSMHSVQMR